MKRIKEREREMELGRKPSRLEVRMKWVSVSVDEKTGSLRFIASMFDG